MMELKACPFCGSAGKMIHPMGHWEPGGYGPDGSRIVCTKDQCSGSGWPFYGDDQDARAIAQWNSRPDDQQSQATERLREAFLAGWWVNAATPGEGGAGVREYFDRCAEADWQAFAAALSVTEPSAEGGVS